jgi:hypothetical protein
MGQTHQYGSDSVWLFYRSRGKGLDVGYFHTPHGMACVAGLLLMAVLLVARSKWLRFPLHPLGYLVYCLAPAHHFAGQDGVKWQNALWGPMLVAWLIKRTIIRYGGMKLYRRLLPIFLGMILGTLLMYVFWNVAHGVMLWQKSGTELMFDLDQPIYRPDYY